VAGATVEVRGVRELARTLRQAGVGLEQLKDAHAKVSQIVARGAAVRAPRVSGALAGSVKGTRRQSAAVVRAGNGRVPYAGVQNFGWPRRHIRGTHFLQMGAQTTRAHWMAEYEREVEALCRTVHGA